MSETRTYIGTIKKFIPDYGETYSEWARGFLKNLDKEFNSRFFKDEIDQAIDECWMCYDKQLIRIGDDIYEYTEDNIYDEDFCLLEKQEDGSFKYVTRFYDGGTCTSEMIRYELEKILNNNNETT